MKKILVSMLVLSLFITGMVQANEVALVFDANDIFNYATSDDTRLNQQGDARMVYGFPFPPGDSTPTGRYYQTYSDSTRDAGPPVATATQDLQSLANILGWTAFAGHQGFPHLQLWLMGGPNAPNWGENVISSSFTSASVNGENEWTADVSTGYVHYNTVLGDCSLGHCNAISSYRPAAYLWSVTGNFQAFGTDLVVGEQYTIWFDAILNNWHYVDAYGNDAWGGYPQPHVEGTIIAVAMPHELVDDVNDCKVNADNHGEFVSCVTELTNEWKKDGLISGKEKGAIQNWAARN